MVEMAGAAPRTPLPLTSPASELVIEALVRYGDSTRAQVASRTGLSLGAVTKAVRPLLASEHLLEGDQVANVRGRPTGVLSINAGSAHFVGVKIADDTLIGSVVDLAGTVLGSADRQLAATDPVAVVDDIATLADEIVASTDVPGYDGLGIACSGQVAPWDGRVVVSPFLGWREVPLARLVAQRTGVPVAVDNDVRALAAIERTFGIGRTARSFVLLSIGQGVGCALCLDGQVWHGADGAAGEIGHVAVGDDRRECYCGSSGCVELLASDQAVVRESGAASLDEALERARREDPQAVEAFARAAAALGRGVLAVTNIVGPEVVVVTGEQVTPDDPRVLEVGAVLRERAYGSLRSCEVLVRPHRFEDWARGAAVLALHAFLRR